MAAASIEIDVALTGSHVRSTFTASGTYSPDAGAPVITCSLAKAGVSWGSGPGVLNAANLSWTCKFTGLGPSSDLVLAAEITDGTSDSDEHPNITVDADPPPIELDPLSPPPRGVIVRANYDVAGSHKSKVKHIICAGVFYKAGADSKRIDKIDAVVVGSVNDPNPGKWKARLSLDPVPGNQKLGILVIGIGAQGRILGTVFHRRK